jgi:cell division protein FtsQ
LKKTDGFELMAHANKQQNSRGAVSRNKPSRTINLSRLQPLLSAVACLVVSALVISAVSGLISQPVERVVVNGEFRNVVRQSISDEVTPYLTGGFIFLDLQGIKTQLLARPWVYEVAVSRKWPNQIVIAVTEQTPIARWGSNGFLNHRGDVFESTSAMAVSEQLPRLHGPLGSSGKVVGHYSEWRKMLQQKKINIYQLELAKNGGWSALIGAGENGHRVPVAMGSGDVMAKMRRFIGAYDDLLAEDFARVARIDIRYNNGLAIAWRSEEILPSASG